MKAEAGKPAENPHKTQSKVETTRSKLWERVQQSEDRRAARGSVLSGEVVPAESSKGEPAFTERELQHARAVISSLAGEGSTWDHVATAGFLELEVTKLQPDGKHLEHIPVPRGHQPYLDAHKVFEVVSRNSDVTEAIKGGFISRTALDDISHKIAKGKENADEAIKKKMVTRLEGKTTKVVGMGVFPLPGEKRREARSSETAKQLLAWAEEATLRSEPSEK